MILHSAWSKMRKKEKTVDMAISFFQCSKSNGGSEVLPLMAQGRERWTNCVMERLFSTLTTLTASYLTTFVKYSNNLCQQYKKGH